VTFASAIVGCRHANLEAEIAQRATQIVLDVERLGLQKLATGQQHAALLAGQRLDMRKHSGIARATAAIVHRSLMSYGEFCI
jgi:hypothetical protein